MSVFEFDVESLYDESIADAGVDFRVEKNGKYFGTFTMRYVDETRPAGELEYKRVRAQYAKKIRTNQMDMWESLAVSLSHVQVIGWKDIKRGGKPVDFSVEAALAFFKREDTRWIAIELAKFANDSSNFVSDAEFEAREITKNS